MHHPKLPSNIFLAQIKITPSSGIFNAPKAAKAENGNPFRFHLNGNARDSVITPMDGTKTKQMSRDYISILSLLPIAGRTKKFISYLKESWPTPKQRSLESQQEIY